MFALIISLVLLLIALLGMGAAVALLVWAFKQAATAKAQAAEEDRQIAKRARQIRAGYNVPPALRH